MPIYGPAAANPNRGNPKPASLHEYDKFHRQAEAKWGIDTKADEAARKGVQLMVKSHLTGDVIPVNRFFEDTGRYGKVAVASVAEISSITDHVTPAPPVRIAARA
ncbi:hypothetical protein HZB74_03125 [Candidatus Saccharibacteria bacterium]|nr:hypothetical protein [Candidatus Saccharibacteria bacterium]